MNKLKKIIAMSLVMVSLGTSVAFAQEGTEVINSQKQEVNVSKENVDEPKEQPRSNRRKRSLFFPIPIINTTILEKEAECLEKLESPYDRDMREAGLNGAAKNVIGNYNGDNSITSSIGAGVTAGSAMKNGGKLAYEKAKKEVAKEIAEKTAKMTSKKIIKSTTEAIIHNSKGKVFGKIIGGALTGVPGAIVTGAFIAMEANNYKEGYEKGVKEFKKQNPSKDEYEKKHNYNKDKKTREELIREAYSV